MLKSLRLRVALAIGLGALLLVVCIASVLALSASRSSLREQADTLDTLARNTATVLADGLSERLREVELLSGAPPRNGLAGWSDLLTRVQRSRPRYSWIGLSTPDGVVQVATGGLLLGVNVGARPWFQAARQGPHVGDVHAAKLLAQLLPPSISGEPVRFIDFAAPVRDEDGTVRAVLGVHASWDWAHDVIASLRSPLARENGVRIFIFDRQGQLIHRPQGMAADEPTIKLAALPTQPTVLPWDDGQAYLTVAQRLPAASPTTDMGWTVVVRQPRDQALAGATRARDTALAVGAVAVLLSVLLAWLMAERFSSPLARVAAAAHAVQAGQLQTEIPLLPGSRELEGLSLALRGMTSSLVQREQELAQANQSLEQRVQERTAELMQAQAALQRANDELQTLASRDGLTGLLNRRAGDERLRQEMARHRRTGQPFALAVADIDHFKAVNDNHGHGVGDEVLRDVAHLLTAACRMTDVIIRQGGEEFLILMPDTSAEGARIACDKMRLAVAAHRGRVPVTLSMGIAAPAQAYGLAEAALEAADQALYAAKKAGRNRVLMTPLPAELPPPMDFSASRAAPLDVVG
jgi:diguanylate cyclase (GGDEF)-like protein